MEANQGPLLSGGDGGNLNARRNMSKRLLRNHSGAEGSFRPQMYESS